MKKLLPLLCLLAILVPLTVTSTPPAEPPLNSYRISGTLLRPGGRPLTGATVAFAARCGESYVLLSEVNGCTCTQTGKTGSPSDQTAVDGGFTLDLISCELFDSLALAVVTPEGFQTVEQLARKNATKEQSTQNIPSESSSFFYCSVSTGVTTVQTNWVYSFPTETITLASGGGW
jgi:hypothetical protein